MNDTQGSVRHMTYRGKKGDRGRGKTEGQRKNGGNEGGVKGNAEKEGSTD